MNTMTYRGYAARIEYSDENRCLVGHIAGINDVVGFHGESVAELRTAFEEAVEDYLEACEKLGRAPRKPYSGKLMLRVPPEVHAAVAAAAEVSGKSINQWATEAFTKAVHAEGRGLGPTAPSILRQAPLPLRSRDFAPSAGSDATRPSGVRAFGMGGATNRSGS